MRFLLTLVFVLLPCGAIASLGSTEKPAPNDCFVPYLDASTLAVGRLDAAKLEPKKLAGFLTKTGFVARPVDQKGLDQVIAQADAFLTAARSVGVGSVFIVARFDAAFDRQHSIFPLMDVLFLFPDAADGDAVLKLIDAKVWKPGKDVNPPYFSWFVRKGVLAVGMGRAEERWAQRKPSPRPDLLAALAKASDAVAAMAFAPSKDQARVFLEMMPRLPLEIGGQPTRMLLDGCGAATLSLDQGKPALRLNVTSASPEAAVELEKWLKERYAQLLAIPEARKELPFLAGAEGVLLPKAIGSGLTLELDAGEAKLGELARTIRNRLLASRGAMLAGSQMRNILIAMHNYHADFGKLPEDYRDKNGKPLLSWRVALLPYLEQDHLWKGFRTDEPWDSPHNKKLLERMPSVYRRPEADAPLFAPAKAAPGSHAWNTPYLAPALPGSAFAEAKPLTLGKLTQGDGTSNTVALVEVNDEQAATWTKPEDWKPTETAGAKELFAWPDGRVNLAFFDASVRRAKPTMPFKILKQLIGWNDGMNEDVEPWFGP